MCTSKGEYLKRGVGEEVSSTSEEDRVITIEVSLLNSII